MIHSLIAKVLDREGGYVNHFADRGGPTNMGITLAALQDHRKRPCTAYDVQTLTRQEATEIYYTNYWVAPGFDRLGRSDVVNDLLFDAGVHHGPSRAVKMLQKVLKVAEDGVIGPATVAALGRYSEAEIGCNFMAERVSFIGRLITDKPSQAAFAAGWANRMAGLIRQLPHIADKPKAQVSAVAAPVGWGDRVLKLIYLLRAGQKG